MNSKGVWRKTPYGGNLDDETGEWYYPKGRWTISNGHVSFDIHYTIDGSISKNFAREAAERRGEKMTDDHFIVTPKEADEYADWIISKLNNTGEF